MEVNCSARPVFGYVLILTSLQLAIHFSSLLTKFQAKMRIDIDFPSSQTAVPYTLYTDSEESGRIETVADGILSG